MKYIPPGQAGSIVAVLPRYDNFIGGKWLPPAGSVPMCFSLGPGGGQRFITRSAACPEGLRRQRRCGGPLHRPMLAWQ